MAEAKSSITVGPRSILDKHCLLSANACDFRAAFFDGPVSSVRNNKDDIREGNYTITFVVLGAKVVVSLFILLLVHFFASDLLSNNRTAALLLLLVTFVARTTLYRRPISGHFNKRKILDCLFSSGLVLLYTRRSVRGVWSRTRRGTIAYLISLLLIALISTYHVLGDIGATVPSFAELRTY